MCVCEGGKGLPAHVCVCACVRAHVRACKCMDVYIAHTSVPFKLVNHLTDFQYIFVNILQFKATP